MTVAEIHGKLTPYESLEDLLTSDVFGAFKYCSPQEALIPFLKNGVPFIGSASKLDFLDNVKSAHYFFWPRSLTDRQPDLIIILTLQDNNNVAINIEAKYLSGKHNIDIDESHISIGELLSKTEQRDHVGDQLLDQYKALKNKRYHNGNLREGIEAALNSCKQFYLFYVTSHYLLPSEDIEETINKDSDNDSKYFYWLNWAKAWEVCKINRNIILDDLRQLLEKKGLTELNLWENIAYIPNPLENCYFWTEER